MILLRSLPAVNSSDACRVFAYTSPPLPSLHTAAAFNYSITLLLPVLPLCRYDLRTFSFSVRVVNLWNTLAEKVVSADLVDTSKYRLDKL